MRLILRSLEVLHSRGIYILYRELNLALGGGDEVTGEHTGVIGCVRYLFRFRTYKLLYHSKQNLGGEGASDTRRQVPLLVNF